MEYKYTTRKTRSGRCNVGEPPTRWSDDMVRVARRLQMRMAQHQITFSQKQTPNLCYKRCPAVRTDLLKRLHFSAEFLQLRANLSLLAYLVLAHVKRLIQLIHEVPYVAQSGNLFAAEALLEIEVNNKCSVLNNAMGLSL